MKNFDSMLQFRDFFEFNYMNDSHLNKDLKLNISDDRKAAEYLVGLIMFWQGKAKLFCTAETTSKKMEKWSFSYKTPSTCGGCIRAQEVISKIFGSCENFNSLPFVTYIGDRHYSFSFAKLKDFAKGKK